MLAWECWGSPGERCELFLMCCLQRDFPFIIPEMNVAGGNLKPANPNELLFWRRRRGTLCIRVDAHQEREQRYHRDFSGNGRLKLRSRWVFLMNCHVREASRGTKETKEQHQPSHQHSLKESRPLLITTKVLTIFAPTQHTTIYKKRRKLGPRSIGVRKARQYEVKWKRKQFEAFRYYPETRRKRECSVAYERMAGKQNKRK